MPSLFKPGDIIQAREHSAFSDGKKNLVIRLLSEEECKYFPGASLVLTLGDTLNIFSGNIYNQEYFQKAEITERERIWIKNLLQNSIKQSEEQIKHAKKRQIDLENALNLICSGEK